MAVKRISNENDMKLCVVMVGLPARGKSYISQKIVRYLSWLSIGCKCFNVGNYRRVLGVDKPKYGFFDFDNMASYHVREAALEMAFKDITEWFDGNSDSDNIDNTGHSNGSLTHSVAILDATNSTRERRDWILQRCHEHGIQPMFLESWCDDPETIAANIKDIATTSPDYEGQDECSASQDFKKRIENYKSVYSSLNTADDKSLTFVKLINISHEIVINRIETYLQSRIVFYVMNIRIRPKCIWLSRHGESIYNVEQKIGGDSSLSERGLKYAAKLRELINENVENNERLSVWTSTLCRTQQTAQYLPYEKLEWKALDELDAGVCDGMTYEEIEDVYPEDFKARDDDKYEYRYRGGESYRDVVIRLEPVIMELERQENVLIITHQAVLRCIYAYFMNVPKEESPWVSIPLHTLIKLEPRAYGTKVTLIKANIPAVSTYKEKGTSHVGESTDAEGAHNMLVNAPEMTQ
ncbi:fructose-2,6-bisphosphatase [Maudiozyma humilis]|uniref:fructose-2,6-bisphosphate 2-phosphatase n=1 Tax=Maudiozyma humilis TaxID=51915 RepID=A0AAV5RUF3_MAUHU|nr:fructose-2,6-bisphosphatase [Kazachstania humilis]